MTTLPFVKYTALGNDYILVENEYGHLLDSHIIRQICDRKFGLGADGILLSNKRDKLVSIFNSDGSEAQKSGNGLRIFAQHLLRESAVTKGSFIIHCGAGGHEVTTSGDLININMGHIRNVFDPHKLRWERYDVNSTLPVFALEVLDKVFECVAVDIGNPHCVVLNAENGDLIKYGKGIENHRYFKDRANVQFVYYCTETLIDIGVWERGSGHTLASGSSSTAVFLVANSLGMCSDKASVRMEGGSLDFYLDSDGIWMQGKVEAIADGHLYINTKSDQGDGINA